MRLKPPPLRALLPLLLALVAAAPEAPPLPPDFRSMCPYEPKLCIDYDTLKAELDGAAGQTQNGDRLAKLNADLIGRSPCRGIKVPKGTAKVRRIAEPTDVQRLADAIGVDPRT